MRQPIAFSALLIWLLAIGSDAAMAVDTIDWKVVGSWDIRVDPSVNFGCFMLASYTRGDVFRFGFDRQSAHGYIIVGNANWHSISAGSQYPISLQFDSETPWTGNALGVDVGDGLKGLELSFTDQRVMQELAERQVLSISYQSSSIASLPLTGTGTAVAELVSCQNQVDRTVAAHRQAQPPADPFASPVPAPPSDPFAH
jgi:hypothetical protein